MLLAINIGNSNITLGGFGPEGELRFSARMWTDVASSSDELVYKLVNLLELYGITPAEIDAVILSSVVPALTPRMREAVARLSGAALMTVGPGLRSGVPIRLDNPAQLGGELLCAAVAALHLCKPPLIVMNLDTATTIIAVGKDGSLLGGSILPGPQLSLNSLVRNTAQLPQVELDTAPRGLLGANTADCLHSGIVYGTAAMMDGMLTKYRAVLQCPEAPVIATGVLPPSIQEACTVPITYRETLVLDGLYAIWKRNRKD